MNPRVEVIASTSIQDLASEEALSAFDLIVLTDSDKDTIVSLSAIWTAFTRPALKIDWTQTRTNDLCRKLGKKFYACGSYGLHGYIFADLLEHEWIMCVSLYLFDSLPSKEAEIPLSML